MTSSTSTLLKRQDTEAVAEVDAAKLAQLRSFIAAGESDHRVCVALDVRPSDLKILKRALLDQENTALTSQTTSDVFIEYRLRMERICEELDGVHTGAIDSRQFTAAMGALKAKAQIIDKVIDRGQDMGLISRAAKKHEVIGGVAVAHLTDEQLLGKMKEIHETTESYMKVYGSESMENVVIPDIYEGE